MKNNKCKEILRIITFIILNIILIISLYKIYIINKQSNMENEEFKAIAEKINNIEESTTYINIEEDTKENIDKDIEEKIDRLSRYKELYKENSDLFGWITIDDTPIDYPVMYTPDDPEYYLHRSFNKKQTYSGCIFIDGNCDSTSNNYLLHGHHMKNGTMFASLLKYKDEKYWKEHPIIKFDTLDIQGDYYVIAAFESQVYKNTDKVFKYYNYTHINSEEKFNEYLDGINALRLYDTHVDVSYGDEFITLSTCAYHVEDGRFVVVGVKKKE